MTMSFMRFILKLQLNDDHLRRMNDQEIMYTEYSAHIAKNGRGEVVAEERCDQKKKGKTISIYNL